MATRKIYDLAVKTGEYTDRNGETKARWQNVGAVMEKDDGSRFVMLERTFNPAGVPNPDNRSTVLLSMFEPRDRDDVGGGRGAGGGAPRNSSPPRQQQREDDLDDDIPF